MDFDTTCVGNKACTHSTLGVGVRQLVEEARGDTSLDRRVWRGVRALDEYGRLDIEDSDII